MLADLIINRTIEWLNLYFIYSKVEWVKLCLFTAAAGTSTAKYTDAQWVCSAWAAGCAGTITSSPKEAPIAAKWEAATTAMAALASSQAVTCAFPSGWDVTLFGNTSETTRAHWEEISKCCQLLHQTLSQRSLSGKCRWWEWINMDKTLILTKADQCINLYFEFSYW